VGCSPRGEPLQILIYHGKYGDEYWLADTPERLNAALQQLFQRLDEWHCYEDDEEGLAEARAGNPKAIRWILDRHNGYEYEGWDLEEATDPCTP
jgi:hypothetical protein